MRTERYTFEKEEVKQMIKDFKASDEKEALELWAYNQFDLKHNASLFINDVGKSFVEIKEMS